MELPRGEEREEEVGLVGGEGLEGLAVGRQLIKTLSPDNHLGTSDGIFLFLLYVHL